MKQKMLTKIKSMSKNAKTFCITTSAIATSALTVIPVHAAETGLDPTVQSAITSGFTNAGQAITVIVGLGVGATVGVIAVSGGAKAGLKWVKGVFSKAS